MWVLPEFCAVLWVWPRDNLGPRPWLAHSVQHPESIFTPQLGAPGNNPAFPLLTSPPLPDVPATPNAAEGSAEGDLREALVLDPVGLDPMEDALAYAPPSLHARGRVGAGRGPAPACDSSGVLKSGRLAGLSLNRAIVMVAWPVLCESFLNFSIGLVDQSVASHLSQSAADAVSGAVYLTWFIGLVAMAIGVGATALIARSLGAGRRAVARAALGQSVLFAALGGVIVAVLLVLGRGVVAQMLSMKGEAAEDLSLYLTAYALGVPFSTILFAGNACARGAGDTVRPLVTMLVVNAVNIVLAWFLGIQLKLGVVGIGAATATAHVIGAVMIISFHARGASGVLLARRWLAPHRVTLYRLLRLGLPNFVETLGMWVVNFTVSIMVGWMGAAAVARHDETVVGDSGGLLSAHVWAIRIESVSFMLGMAMGIAAGALAGQYLGAGRPDLARRAALRCAAIGATIMGCFGFAFIFAGQQIIDVLSEQPAHRLITPTLLAITGWVQIPFALGIVLRSAMHGAGDVRAVMIMTWISQWGLRLPLAYMFSGVAIPIPEFLAGAPGKVFANPFPFDLGIRGVWYGLTAELTIRAVIYGGRFVHGGWLKARV
ncbi:MATE family efflux transporter [soil metagenome]